MAYLEGPDGTRHHLTGSVVTVGRDASNDLVLPADRRVSRRQAELRLRDDQWVLVDLDSRNGTFVADRPVQLHPLADGDRLRFGGSILVFVAEADPNATEVGTGTTSTDRWPELTNREREVVALVAQGLTDREIGERLFISPSTVRSHLDRISERTGLRRRSELTRLAVDLGLVG